MKKIAFISKRKVLIQSLCDAIKSNSRLNFETYSLYNIEQSLVDVEVLGVDVIVIDVSEDKKNDSLSLCDKLRTVLPDCKLLLLISLDDKEAKDFAVSAVKDGSADDFVFYDTSLEYLFAKLAAF